MPEDFDHCGADSLRRKTWSFIKQNAERFRFTAKWLEDEYSVVKYHQRWQEKRAASPNITVPVGFKVQSHGPNKAPNPDGAFWAGLSVGTKVSPKGAVPAAQLYPRESIPPETDRACQRREEVEKQNLPRFLLAVSDILELDARVLTSDQAARALYVVWLLQDPEAHLFRPVLGAFQDWPWSMKGDHVLTGREWGYRLFIQKWRFRPNHHSKSMSPDQRLHELVKAAWECVCNVDAAIPPASLDRLPAVRPGDHAGADDRAKDKVAADDKAQGRVVEQLSLDARAVAVLSDNQHFTKVTQVARLLNVAKQSLSRERCPMFRASLDGLLAGGRPPRGHRAADGDVENDEGDEE